MVELSYRWCHRHAKNLSAVLLTLVNSFSVVSLKKTVINFWLFGYFSPLSATPGKNVVDGVVDTSDKFTPKD